MQAFGYWGKAQAGWHLLPYHCLDVAACAVALLRQRSEIAQTLSRLTGLPAEALASCVGWAAALHDIGKLSPAFQWKVPELARQLGQVEARCPADVRHDSLGWVLWRDSLSRRQPLPLAEQERADVWLRCATGHHGVPPSRGAGGVPIRLRQFFPGGEAAAAAEWRTFVDGLFAPDWALGDVNALEQASWWIAGLVTLGDWLGSSTEWFPYRAGASDPGSYWESACQQAATAIQESGLARTPSRRSFATLFPSFRPTAIQAEITRLAADRPFLLIVEEATGGGKTEGALAAAGGDAYFFGLPTMATANGLWARVGDLSEQQALIHGKRWLLPAAMQRASAWLNDSSRKALLANVGVGTVDQAMLAVLKARYSALRLLALAGRTLIVDEVHAYDEYMTRILERLVEFQARAGGNVVLLSATMPLSVREGFAQAWARGRGVPVPRFDATDFPLLSFSNGEQTSQAAVPSYRQTRVDVERVTRERDCVERITAAVRRGQCVVWIRNTVREALAAHAALLASGIDANLFHARFAQAHRLVIEAEVRATFGKASAPAERAGQVLVATQVVEQSLDLDFDLLITDLAPIDLVIQRAGRLHRHDRGPRGTPLLVLHSPPWSEEPESTWISDWSSDTARVYPDHGRLWLTLKLLGSGFALPDDSRRLVEGVYGEDAAAMVPEGLNDRSDRASRDRAAQTHAARANTISSEDAYAATDLYAWDDEEAPTRLGERSREWVLCEHGEPVAGDVEGSVVSLRASAISKAPECPLVAAGSWRRTLDLHNATAACARPDGSALIVRYDRRRGLSLGD